MITLERNKKGNLPAILAFVIVEVSVFLLF